MYRVLLLLLVACSNAVAQDIAIRDIDYRSDYYLSETNDSNIRIIYKVKGRNQQQSHFRKIDFDSLLRLSDTTEIKLSGNYKLLATTEGERYIATVVGSKDNGMLQLHWLNKQTEEHALTRINIPTLYTKKVQVKVHPSSDDESFFVLYSTNGDRQWEAILISKDGKIKSKRIIDGGGQKLSITQSLLLNDNLVMIISKNPKSKARAYETLVLDGYTGKDKSAQVLSNQGSRLAIDNIFLTDSVLYLAGRKFFSNRVKNNQPGMPGLVSIDLRTHAITETPLNVASLPNNVFWMDVVELPDGNKYLIGETFTSEPYGAYFMKGLLTGIATLGMFTVTWCNLKWLDVVALPIDEYNAKPLYCKIAQRKVQSGAHLPPYLFANYAHRSGQVRYFGHDQQGHIYLLDDGIFKKYTPDLKQFTNLGVLPSRENSIVLALKDTYALVAVRGVGVLDIVVFKFAEAAPRKNK